MGLIRSNQTSLTPDADDKLTEYLWPIVCEMIKTAIENNQNLIIEGVYIPFNHVNSFDEEYLKHIKAYCLVLSKEYIETPFEDIKSYANTIEKKIDDSYFTKEDLIQENESNLKMCRKYNIPYILIEDNYDVETILNQINI